MICFVCTRERSLITGRSTPVIIGSHLWNRSIRVDVDYRIEQESTGLSCVWRQKGGNYQLTQCCPSNR